MATISTTYLGDMLFETQVGNQSIRIDVPVGMGGKNRAPTPPEYFFASLGSCVAAFVASYCNNTDIDPTQLRVDVHYDKLTDPIRFTNIRLDVHLPNATCARRAEAIKRVAAHCPVHETIQTLEGIEINIIDKATPPAEPVI